MARGALARCLPSDYAAPPRGLFDATNLNGSADGLGLSGPVDLFQRVGWGTPLANMLQLFPSLNNISTPSLPILPTGVTAGPDAPYLYAGIHEQDISAQSASRETHRESNGRGKVYLNVDADQKPSLMQPATASAAESSVGH